MRLSAILALAATLAACAKAQEVTRPGGPREYLIACGATTGWDVCHGKAAELCPAGYGTLDERLGFTRRELHVACRAEGAPTG